MTRACVLPPVAALAAVFSYDPDSGELRRGRRVVGWIDRSGYVRVRMPGSRRKLSAHAVAWALMTGEAPALHVDHRNRNRADNRWENLRLLTQSENNHNRGVARNNTSGWTGVLRRGRRWIAVVHWRGRAVWLGTYDTAEEAGRARAAWRPGADSERPPATPARRGHK